MKNIIANRKTITLILLTVLLVFGVQSTSDSFFGDIIGAIGDVLGAIGEVGGIVVDVIAGTVKIAAEVVGLSIRIVATIVWHTDSLQSIELFPNGGLIGVVVSNFVHLWDPITGQTTATLAHDATIRSIAFSPDGLLLASTSEDSTVQLWNPETFEHLATFGGHTDIIQNVDFSPNGWLLASASADNTVRLWNLETRTSQATLQGHTDNVLSVDFSPNGWFLASTGADGTVRLWDPDTNTLQATLMGHADSVLDAAFSPNGLLLASASADGTVRLWNLNTNTLQATLDHKSPVLSIAFSPHGDILASGSTDGTARFWDPNTGKVIATLGHESPVRSVTFNADGNILYSASADGKMRQWEVATEAESQTPNNITPVIERTPQVRQAILGVVRLDYPNVSNYPDITETHLASPTVLYLNNRNITALKSGDFDGLTGLEELLLYSNRLTNLPADIFSGLSSLQTLRFGLNQLRTLPPGLFDGLTALRDLRMIGNRLTTLPDGVFEGLTGLTRLSLGDNTANPLPLIISLKRVGNGQFKAVAPTGAPFDIVLPLTVANGSIDGGATMLTIPAGTLESEILTVTSTFGTTFAVTVDIRTLPRLPTNHQGYALTKSNNLPLEVISADTTNIGTQVTAVNIPDSNLRAKIEIALGKTSGAPISVTEMATLTTLTAQDARITNLTGLETATNLTTLKLGNNLVSDISTLAGLTNLTELHLWDNQLSNVSALVGLTNLTRLYLWGNTISDISHVAGLTNLTRLRIGENSISNISTVSSLTNLTYLSVKENSISDISAVSGLTNLTQLQIGNNTISDITPVQNLTNLEWLDMPNNSISDISAVQNLTQLVELYFQNNAVSDLSPLAANTGLGADDEIDVRGNPLSYPSVFLLIPILQERDVYVEFDNRTPTMLMKISGDTQRSGSGTALAQPFVVEVRDTDSATFVGVPVTFTVATGGGSLSAANTTTDANGRTQSTLTLGNTAGTNTVRVNVQGISASVTFTATATTTNTAPVFTDSTTTRTIAENTAANVNIGTAIAATDADSNTLTYALGGTDAASFDINTTSGQLRTKAVLDYETKRTYTVTITVSDGSLTDTITVTIYVTDVHELPTRTAVCQVGDVLAPGESCTYPNTDVEFSVLNNGSGQFLFFTGGSSLNIEDTEINGVSYTLVSKKLTSGSWEIEKIADSKEAPEPTNTAPVFTEGANTTRTIAENTAANVSIGTAIAATDTNNDTLTYMLSGPDASSFAIDSTTGQLKTNAALDYETKTTYVITITVSDGNLTNTITVTVNVTDIDELPTSTGICKVGDTLAPRESCTYPGTDAVFSVLDNGSSKWDIPNYPWLNKVSVGGSMSVTATVNDKNYHFVAKVIPGNSWEIEEIGDDGNQKPSTPEQPEDVSGAPTLSVSTAAPLTEAMLHEGVVTLTLNDGTYESSSFRIKRAVTVSGITGVTVGTFGVRRVSDTEVTLEFEFDGNFDTDGILTVSLGAGAIADYNGASLSAQVSVTAVTESVVASTAAPLTEATLDESIVTLTFSGRTYEGFSSKVRDAVTVSGIPEVTVKRYDVDRVSETEVTVELTFNGDLNTDSTLTFTVGAGAIAGYNGPALTAQVSVSVSTEAPDDTDDTTPVTDDTTPVVDDTTPGICKVGDVLSSGESCTYPGTDTAFSVNNNGSGRFLFFTSGNSLNIKDTEINGESYTLVAKKLASGSWEIEEIGDSTDQQPDTSERPGDKGTSEQPIETTGTPTLSASTAASLTEATLHEGVVTLTLNGGTYERSSFRIKGALTVSGITGVTVGTFGVDRVSDTKVTVELEFDDNLNTDSTLTLTLGAGAIADYNGTSLTVQIPVTASTESVVASTVAPLTEATLDESIVTLTLSGRTYEGFSSKVRDAVTVSGIPEVTVKRYDVDRVSETEVTVELTFNGDLNTDSTLTFTVGAGAIAGYNGPALTSQVSVSASTEAPNDTDGTTPVVVDTTPVEEDTTPVEEDTTPVEEDTTPVEEDTIPSVCKVGDVLVRGESCTYPGTDAEFSVLNNGSGRFLFFTSGNSLNIKDTEINGESYTLVAEKLASGSWKIEEIGDSGDQQPDTSEQPEQPGDKVTPQQPIETTGTPTLSASTAASLTEATLHEGVVTLTLSGGTYERSSFRIKGALTVSGITGVTVSTFGVDRVSDTKVTVELEFNGNIDTNSTLTFTVGAGAIVDYDGVALTAQVSVTALSESVVASTTTSLTEAALDESVVTLTLSGATYERSSFNIRGNVRTTGINGVTVGTFGVDRVSDTKVTVELEFDGTDFDTNSTLIFTVEAEALAGYNGPALTTQISVTALTESVVATTAAPLTEGTLDEGIVTLTLSGRSFERSGFRIKDAVAVFGITGVTVGTFGVDRVSDTEVTVELGFDGNIDTDSTLTFTVGADAIANYNGSALTAQITVTAIREDALLVNFPNPFNPETWIPYQLSKPADVTITIYAVNGQVVRRLALGHQLAGIYQSRSRAAYWDGKNIFGESVASGVYFYTLTAGHFTATRKMLIRK